MSAGCDLIERVPEYALRALPANERPAFEAHVGGCEACRQELDALRPVVEAMVDWPTDVLRPPAPLWDRLAKRIAPDGAKPTEARAVESEWKEVGSSGIFYKVLAAEEATGRVSLLVRLAPGAEYPPHRHAGVEELHLLEGELWIDDQKLVPGDYRRAEPGTQDRRVWSETGCTCVLLTSSRDILE